MTLSSHCSDIGGAADDFLDIEDQGHAPVSED